MFYVQGFTDENSKWLKPVKKKQKTDGSEEDSDTEWEEEEEEEQEEQQGSEPWKGNVFFKLTTRIKSMEKKRFYEMNDRITAVEEELWVHILLDTPLIFNFRTLNLISIT